MGRLPMVRRADLCLGMPVAVSVRLAWLVRLPDGVYRKGA
jgi:hypothetical protein